MITLMLVEMLLVDESFCDFVLIARGVTVGILASRLILHRGPRTVKLGQNQATVKLLLINFIKR